MPNVKFEDVYANAYVRESVAYLVATTIRQYPMLANSEKDLEQELWIALARKLPRFQSARSSLNKFCRVILEVSLKEIRRKLFSRRSIVARTSLELTMEMQEFLTWDGLEKAILIFDVQSVLQNLSRAEGNLQNAHGWILHQTDRPAHQHSGGNPLQTPDRGIARNFYPRRVKKIGKTVNVFDFSAYVLSAYTFNSKG